MKSTRWLLVSVVLAALLGAGCSGSDKASGPADKLPASSPADKLPTSSPPPKTSAELEEARDIAKDFLDAVVAAKWQNARTFCAKGYIDREAKVYGGNHIWWDEALAKEVFFGPQPPGSGFFANKPIPAEKQLKSASISTEKMAASLTEASFQGVLTGPQRTASFKLRTLKEKASGKWGVDYLQVTDTQP